MTTAVALAELNAPTPERMRLGDVIPFTTDAGAVKPARVEDVLDRYLVRGELHLSLYNLAREYGALRFRAGLVPNAKANPMLDRVDSSTSTLVHPIEGKTDALSRLVATDAKIKRLSGRRRAAERHLGILAGVCAEGQSASAWAWSYGSRKHGQGLEWLRDALRILGTAWGRR